MQQSQQSSSSSARAILIYTWGIACVLVIAAPWLASHSFYAAASALYFFFSHICHQIPERSFMLFGFPLAVCHRCSGIYIGMFLGCFVEIPAMNCRTQIRRLVVIAAIIPITLDNIASMAGLWHNTVTSRFITGLLFGTAVSALFVRGFSEFLREAPWQRRIQPLRLKGDLS
jgi:uncharacterized membrane protein